MGLALRIPGLQLYPEYDTMLKNMRSGIWTKKQAFAEMLKGCETDEKNEPWRI